MFSKIVSRGSIMWRSSSLVSGKPWTQITRDIPRYCGSQTTLQEFEKNFPVDLQDPSQSFLSGHAVKTVVIFPTTGYFTLAWQALAESHGKKFEDYPVTIENVVLKEATLLFQDCPINLKVSVSGSNGEFAICENGRLKVKGKVRPADSLSSNMKAFTSLNAHCKKEGSLLDKSELYKALEKRGYFYKGKFQGLQRVCSQGSYGEVLWMGNWTSFLDTVFQTLIFQFPGQGLFLPTSVSSFTIYPDILLDYIHSKSDPKIVPVVVEKSSGILHCPGIELKGVNGTEIK